MRRSEQREHIFKLLFMTQFNTENEMPEQLSIYFDGLGELAEADQEAIQQKYDHILEHLSEIDQILNDYSRGWKTSRMNRVDLTALRLAVYEMKMDEDVPVGVAINEAVELAKLFGGEDSGSFVNGILGKIASGKKDSGEEHKKPRRQTHSAKIIIRSSKKDAKVQKDQKASEESAE
ncbi:transcription antitermination factor NusB [Blautia sp. MSJ-19]|uniref:transcription antitermination factor NusB n=1 Tax=Blautia sp. MSJ-19 TaxID=2841517 RepID=UPI001C0F3505|nr:transcription antitermination factor NusB [Blautia sp. MSJ-19]MBU5480848.1 transcription antitermination factor NusB [Blautia sp. MSJ-19]